MQYPGNRIRIAVLAATLGLALGGLVLRGWLQTTVIVVDRRVPVPVDKGARAARVDLRGQLRVATTAASVVDTDSSWPQFRGLDRDNIDHSSPPLAEQWPPEGPPQRWRVELGEGYAGPVVKYGRVYLLDYLEEEKADCLRCFSLADGTELWRRWYKVKVAWSHGFSRTVPAVADNAVVTIGPKCHVVCADAISGAYRWSFDLVADYGTEVPLWYTAQCPLIDAGRVILAPSGTALMMAVDLQTGRVLWEVPNPEGWKMSHSSVMPMTIEGTPMYVYFALGGAVGVSPDGRVLWTTKAWAHNIIAPSPVQLGDGKLLITSGHGVGSLLLQVRKRDDRFEVLPPLRTWTCRELASEQHTPIVYRNRLFTILPKDGGALRLRMLCLDLDGSLRWESGAANRFGLGPFLVADDKLLILEDGGRLTMARASAPQYEELASVDLFEGKEAWAPMAILDGLLLLRDWKTMRCLDLQKGATP